MSADAFESSVIGRTAMLSGRVLVLEQRPVSYPVIAAALKALGCSVTSSTDIASVLELIDHRAVELLICDVRLGGGQSGRAVLEAARKSAPWLPVVMLDDVPSIAEAVRMMEAGAASYFAKPVPTFELVRTVRSALERRRSGPAGAAASRIEAIRPRGFVGDCEPMRSLLEQIALVGPTRTTVLLTGETGTGKERVAEALHAASPRAGGPFIGVNCAALTETILESELFGHERGSFTGAHARREGRFKLADGGTMFLDEIGETSPVIQAKLLRVLQERRFERVGGNETLSVDVRIIAATNRNLRDMVAERSFRADLYYRLNVVALEVPPLRARRADIPALVEHFLARLAADLGVPEPEISAAALRLLQAYDWPGNVRELENVLERALVLSQGRSIDAADLAPQLHGPGCQGGGPVAAPTVPGATFAEIERHAIMTTYEACGRSPQRTAEVLGLSERTVHYRLREYRGEPGRRRRSAALQAMSGLDAGGLCPPEPVAGTADEETSRRTTARRLGGAA